MSPKKLGRIAGLAFMLAALLGGVAVVDTGQPATGDASAVAYSTLDFIWT
jgi:hypothetical protein